MQLPSRMGLSERTGPTGIATQRSSWREKLFYLMSDNAHERFDTI